jgi:hypothetical protein
MSSAAVITAIEGRQGRQEQDKQLAEPSNDKTKQYLSNFETGGLNRVSNFILKGKRSWIFFHKNLI